ncbi:class I SAM-dependent methyltransferase [Mycolicibacterium tusciae]|uniref:class I SAM-dependent methyltransferase n=1 Tax=Mycolicibacterium tusciae TaxID=75922 RepID=UPI001EF98B1E|nr:class I SAM-dependent methyltransferase [Mycolicibacterium tusciae]
MGVMLDNQGGRKRMSTNLIHYSPSFRQLVSDAAELVGLLSGSDVTTDVASKDALAAWEASRYFIASMITRGGSILDYGCANGFLLRCLQEWCPHKLEPYGVDINATRLDRARTILATDSNHFTCPQDTWTMGMRDGFDFVYWAVGDNMNFSDPGNIRWLHAIAALASSRGRFIVGFYDVAPENLRKLEDIERSGFRFTGSLVNPWGSEMIAWLDGRDTRRHVQ